MKLGARMTWDSELERAKSAARAAGAVLREAMSGERKVLSEEGRDIKLQADRDAEAVILETLSGSDYSVLAEESGEHGDTDANTPMWVVDPLDGTLNFKRGIPVCCVSIGLFQGDEPILGVIYDFNHDDLYEGVVWQGAYLNGEPMSVSEITDRSRAIVTSGFPVLADFSDEGIGEFARRVQTYKKVRFLGSAAMSLAYVACGAVEAYIEDDIMLWDIAAGAALVHAAGGHVEIGRSVKKPWARTIRAYSHAVLGDEAT